MRLAANYLGAVGIRVKLRTMERAAYQSARAAKQLRGLCVCVSACNGNAATRIEEAVVTTGTFAYGGYPDLDALFRPLRPSSMSVMRGVCPSRSVGACESGGLKSDMVSVPTRRKPWVARRP